jgi:hypothetical protein
VEASEIESWAHVEPADVHYWKWVILGPGVTMPGPSPLVRSDLAPKLAVEIICDYLENLNEIESTNKITTP